MNAREKILAAISENQPEPTRLPVIDHRQMIPFCEDLKTQFAQFLEAGGGSLRQISSMAEMKQLIHQAKEDADLVLNLIPQTGNVDTIPSSLDALNGLQQVYILGSVAVAENGAVWISETKMLGRILPFITDQLFLVIQEKQLVATMHDAYEQIKIDEDGFGVFIAGPSKTADIEQSLVIGAHGARKLVVLMLSEGG